MANMPKWLENIVFYESYPQTFLDTDGKFAMPPAFAPFFKM
ncbi:MAG: hypothetical protein ACI4EI_10470 [Muricoprocola sp.]